MDWEVAKNAAAIAGAILGLYGAITGTVALRLALRKDRRESEATAPHIHISLSPYYDPRVFSLSISITNRGTKVIGLDRIEMVGPKGSSARCDMLQDIDAPVPAGFHFVDAALAANSSNVWNAFVVLPLGLARPVMVDLRITIITFGAREERTSFSFRRTLP